MADLRISELPALLPADVEAGDDIAVADYSASETRRLTTKGLVQQGVSTLIDDGSIPGAKLVDNSVTALQIGPDAVGASELADNSVDTAAIQASAVTNAKVATNTLTGDRLVANTVTTREIGPDAITATELANNSVDTAAIIDGNVTNAKLAAGIDGAKLTDGSITDAKLTTVNGSRLFADSVTAREIGPNAVTASELADNSVDTAAVINAAITNAKVAPATLTGDRLVAGTVTSREIATDAITASELANNAVDTAAVQNAAITNAKLAAGIDGAKLTDGTVTDAKLASGIDGGKLVAGSVSATQIGPNAVGASQLANNSVDTNAVIDAAITDRKIAGPIDGSKIAPGTLPPGSIGAVTDRGLDQTTGNIGHTNAITAGIRSGITFDAQGHITNTTALIGSDLPVGTATTIGGLSVPASSGLTVNGVGALDHSSSILAGTTSGITYDEHGHITSAAALSSTDLPLATSTTAGAVSVPGPGLTVDGTGAVTHDDTTVLPGSYPKVTVNQQGHVIAGLPLAAADIPNISADKLTSGTLDISRIADRSLTNPKFADYSTVLIQEAEPSGTDHYTGQFWYQESTAQLRTWSGNSWIPVGFGRLSEENLRFCGTFDASTGNVDQITTFGSAAGLVPGAPIPAASDTLTGAYLVATTPGTYNGQLYDNGDWTLCLGQAQGWQRVDTLNGAGSTTVKLSDLLDVTITTAASGDTLIFDGATNKWINKPTAAQKATFVEAIDGSRTTFTLTRDADSANNLLVSLGGIIQEPGVDFTFTAPRTVNFAGPPPNDIDYWIIIEGVASTGGGGGGGTTLPDGTAAEEYLQWSATLGSWQPSKVLVGGTY